MNRYRVFMVTAVCLTLSALPAFAQGREHGASGSDRDDDAKLEREHRDRDRDVRQDRDRERDFGRNRDRDDEHPRGWSDGRKRGWHDCDAPPGLAKKQGCKDWENVTFPQGPRAAPRPVNPDISRAEVARFDRYLDSHPAVARALERNPGLVRNQEFLARNPSLRTWLSTHPETAEEVRETPGQFLSRERTFEGSRADRR
jgi:hypothetical protein